MSDLGSSDHALMFDGEPMDDETRELLRMSLKNQFEYNPQISKEKTKARNKKGFSIEDSQHSKESNRAISDARPV